MKKIILIIILFHLLNKAGAQYQESPVVFAEHAFNNKNYYEAAYFYKKAANGLSLVKQEAIPYHATDNLESRDKSYDKCYICYKLGESYRLYENYLEAESWYYKVIEGGNEKSYPLVRLWYGVCLRANQRFDESIKQIELFCATYTGKSEYEELAKRELENCRFAKDQYQYPSLIEIKKISGNFNSDGSDYALIEHKGNRYFTSSRETKNDKKHINRIYILKKDSSNTPSVINFKSDDKKDRLEYGTPSLNTTGDRMYLTRWYKTGDKTIHAIYISYWANNEWSMPQKLNNNINSDGFDSMQPFITADGKQLFFTSNKPGGQGGDDIWVSELDNQGNPINSANLGMVINTPFDEQAAYYDVVRKKLIYSSKGFVGLGGFDFFTSINDEGKWTTPQNMGYPFNSAKDDLYYLPDPNQPNNFYISSDRQSDCCLNLFEGYDKKLTITGQIFDCDTHKLLTGVKISLIDSLTNQVIKYTGVDQSATYVFTIARKRPYTIVFERSGYFTKIIHASVQDKRTSDTIVNVEMCLKPFIVDKPIAIKNILYDFDKATLRPESQTALNELVKILQDNPKIKVELSSHTDSVGTDLYNIKLSQARAQSCVDYIILRGINENRIYAKGYGKRKPIAPNSFPDGKDNPDGRQLNRRTEFTVTKIE